MSQGKQKKPFEATVTIDGVTVPIAIQRLDVDAWLAFRTEFRYMQARAKRTAELQVAAGADNVAYEAALETERENDIKATRFTRDAITELVSAPTSVLVDDDDEPVTTGAQLFDYYARNTFAISTILAAIFSEHLLTPAQKKALRLALASGSGSAASTAAPSGDKPEPTATSAVSASSAASADATESLSRAALSGSTDR